MLRFLRIRDFALIRNLEIEFGEGLSVLTGETGSGKSIIVDALGLLVGGRSYQEMVRAESDVAVIEGVFAAGNGALCERIAAAGIEVDGNSILIRREIASGGRGRVFINNNLATLSLLRQIGTALADIHGQQEHQALLDLSTHLGWLDRFGKNEAAAGELRQMFGGIRDLSAKLDALAIGEQERQRLLDILRFQVDEIRRVNPRPGEREELDSEKALLANREMVFGLSSEAFSLLYEREQSIVAQVDRLLRVLKQLAEFDPALGEHLEALRESHYRLEDLAYVLRDYAGSIDFSPDRLDRIEHRLSDLERLSAKYGKTAEEILNFAGECERRLEELSSSGDTSVRLTADLEAALLKYRELAETVSAKRHKDAARLEREIRKEFKALAMERTEFKVRFRPLDKGTESPRRIPASCGPDGIDQVEFLLAPNPGEEMRPLARIASGGELSRIMLSIKALCGGGEAGKTLVFDEIDAGIGGRVAEVVGRRLRDVSSQCQVLCVTHLPQIAAHAREHFHVRKEPVGGRTETFIGRLDSAARLSEMARMMGGAVITETTRRHAKEMLDLASRPPRKESQA